MHYTSLQRDLFVKGFLMAERSAFRVWAPGRVNLIGEHTDYNGGLVCPFAIHKGIEIEARLASATEWTLCVGSEFSQEAFQFTASELYTFYNTWCAQSESSAQKLLPEPLQKSWVRYVLGAFLLFIKHVQGLHLPSYTLFIDIRSTLPVGAGLSSSAALCTGLLSLFCATLGYPLSAEEVARLAMLVEHEFSGTKCGLMDQLAVVCSTKGFYTVIDFVDFVPAHKVHIHLTAAHERFQSYRALVFNTGVSHSLADSEYNMRRAACEEALAILNQHTNLAAKTLGEYALPENFARVFGCDFRQISQKDFANKLVNIFTTQVDENKAYILARRVAHVLCEIERVRLAQSALAEGHLAQLDTLMQESHASLRDFYEVSCFELNTACDVLRSLAHEHAAMFKFSTEELPILGPRMTGGGFGGSVVALVHERLVSALVESLSQNDNMYTRQTGKKGNILVTEPQDGLRIALM